jgi:hypothetical protein
MRATLLSCIVVLFSIFSFAQQFQLEATIDKDIKAIFDIDGDGICEYLADTTKIYDGLTHNLKYTIPIGYYLEWGEDLRAQNPYPVFPHIDFNLDGKRDLILDFYTSQGSDDKVLVYDAVNNIVLFEFNQPDGYVQLIDCIDIDGDNELELVIDAETGFYPNTIHKAYIYSTGITTSASEEKKITPPSEYRLKQNFPNPFNPSTTIRYSLSGPENISIKIYDVSGQLVKEINKEHNQAGEFEVIWDGKNNFGERISSGAYFYQLQAGNYIEAKKMILLK